MQTQRDQIVKRRKVDEKDPLFLTKRIRFPSFCYVSFPLIRMSLDVPADSFTAFRLKYSTAREMERDSSVVRLGPIPKAWLIDKKSMLLAKLYQLDNAPNSLNAASWVLGTFNKEFSDTVMDPATSTPVEEKQETGKSKISSNIKEKGNTIKRKLHLKPSASESPKEHLEQLDEIDFHSLNKYLPDSTPNDNDSILPNFHRSASQLLKQKDIEDMRLMYNIYDHSESDEDEEEDDGEEFAGYNIPEPSVGHIPQTATTLTSDEDFDVTLKSNSPLAKHKDRLSTIKRKVYTPELLNRDIERAKKKLMERKISNDDDQSFSDSADSFVTANESLESLVKQQPVVDFVDVNPREKIVEFTSVNMKKSLSTRGSYLYTFESKKLPLRKVEQIPCKDFNKEFKLSMAREIEKTFDESSEDDDYSFIEKTNMKRSKSKFGKVFKDYHAGEIIKLNKVLVLVTAKPKIQEGLIEDETEEKVLDKWREYLIVARFTGNVNYPVLLQFYKTNKILKMDESQIAEKDFSLDVEHKLEQDESDSDFDDLEELNDKQKSTKKHKKNRGQSCHFKIVVSKEDTKIEFFNLLDRALKLTKEHKRIFVNYLLVFHSSSTSVTWINFLKALMGNARKEERETAFIKVPSLDMSFTINNLSKICKVNLHNLHSEFFKVEITPNGYNIKKTGIMSGILDLIQEKMDTYYKSNGKFKFHEEESNKFLDLLKHERRSLALSFRKYDRLEWLIGNQESLKYTLWTVLGSYFELELREFVHDDCHLLQDKMKMEPLPIEGFIVRLSNRKGKTKSHFGRNYFKLLYGYTCKNLLFFQNFFHSVPILGEGAKGVITPNGKILNMKELEMRCAEPLIGPARVYKPYALDDGRHISWLRTGVSQEELKKRDGDALHEAERRSALIANSSTLIDLCNVSEIRKVNYKEVNKLVRSAGLTVWHDSKGLDRGKMIKGDNKEPDEKIDNVFEIILKDGNKVQFQVSTGEVRDQWVSSLLEMSQYWKLKQVENIEKEMKLREMNLDFNPNFDQGGKSNSKWEFTNVKTNESIYSISSHALDKPVLMNGEIYNRLNEKETFRKFYMVLSPGFLTIYDMFNRDNFNTNTPRSGVYYKKSSTLALANCYVFAGNLNTSNGKLGNKYVSMGDDGVPRLYNHGLRSADLQKDRIFSVWFGSKRMLMKSLKQGKQSSQLTQRSGKFNLADFLEDEFEQDTEESDSNSDSENHHETTEEEDRKSTTTKKNNKKIHVSVWDMIGMISKLGTRGRIITFLTNSKLSRDIWVTRLKGEIDRFSINRDDDIDIA